MARTSSRPFVGQVDDKRVGFGLHAIVELDRTSASSRTICGLTSTASTMSLLAGITSISGRGHGDFPFRPGIDEAGQVALPGQGASRRCSGWVQNITKSNSIFTRKPNAAAMRPPREDQRAEPAAAFACARPSHEFRRSCPWAGFCHVPSPCRRWRGITPHAGEVGSGGSSAESLFRRGRSACLPPRDEHQKRVIVIHR